MSPIIIGRFGKTHGVRGWIRVYSLTNPPEKIVTLSPWFLKRKSWEPIIIESSKLQGENILVKLPNCETPEVAQEYVNIEIAINQDQLSKLPKGEYYWRDLEGLDVINSEGVAFGKIDNLIATGANDVLVVIGDRKRLIPYISNVILKVDLDAKVITVDWGADF